MKPKLLVLFFSFCLFVSPVVYAEEGPHVEFFSPQGTVKTVRQVSVRFSEAMVPLGILEASSNLLMSIVQKKERPMG